MFPSVVVPADSAKRQEWMDKWGNAIVSTTGDELVARFQRLHSNRRVYYGDVNGEDFSYLTTMYGVRTPARFVGYPFVYKLVERLVGEATGEQLEFSVESVDSDIISSNLEKKVAAATKVLTLPLRNVLGRISTDELFDTEGEEALPDSIKAFNELNFHDHVEIGMQYVMKHLQQKYSLDLIFTEGMREMAINYEPVYRVYVKNGDPVVENVNPSRITYGRHDQLRWLHEAPWVRDEQELPISQVIDEYRHLFSMEDIARFEEWMSLAERGTVREGAMPWGQYGRYNPNNGQLNMNVVRYEWLAIDNLTFKVSENKYAPDRPFLKMVDRSTQGENLRKYPHNMAYEGVYIAGKHYGQGERPDQVRHNDDYAKTHLSYFGCVRQGISVVDATKNIYLMLCITMYHIEAMLNRSGGKAVVYDLAQKPKKIPQADLFYHAKESGMILINTAEEGFQTGRGFNQFQQVDFTLSQAIQQLFSLKQVLEQTMHTLTGISEGRIGMGHQDEAVKNTQSKIQQSSYITQSMFDDHFKVVEDVMNEVLNLVKIAWDDNSERLLTVFGDRGRETIKFMKGWLGHHYGLYVKNTNRERMRKDNVLATAQAALSSGQLDFQSWLTISNKSTSKEMERVFNGAMRVMREQQQQSAQAQQQDKAADRVLKQQEIQSRIMAARIEAGAYVETKRLEIAARYGLQDSKHMADLTKVTEESRAALDQITAEARMKAQEEIPAGDAVADTAGQE